MGSNDTNSADESGTGLRTRVRLARRSFAAVVFNVTEECVLYSIGSRDLRLKLRVLNPASWFSLLLHKSPTRYVN